MKRGIPAFPLVLCVIFSSLPLVALAEVIDSFTAPQGPFTVGPGEEISEEEAVVQSDSVLGGFRVMLPGVDEDAQGGSTASLSIGGGSMDCSADFPGPGEDNNAFCSGGYDRGEGATFDLTGSTEFRFDVQTVEGTVFLGVTLVDTNEEISLNLLPVLTPGQLAIPFASLLSPTSPDGVDYTLIDNIAFAIIYAEGQEGRIVLNEFSTDGPIGEGPVIPVDDEIVSEEIPGTYFNVSRNGEGCNLTKERSQTDMVLTCYFYLDGEQFWLIGQGELVDGQILFAELIITEGGQYGDDFNPDDVVFTTWGSGLMTWSDCNNADLDLMPIVPGYEAVTLEFTRIVPTTCGGGGVEIEEARRMGVYYDVARNGEGFHLGAEADSRYVLFWYTYLNGKQVWLIGEQVEREGNRVVFQMYITYGADFGSEFDPADVLLETFGEITIEFTDCNNFTATVDTVRPEFHDIELESTKIVPGACD